LAGQLSSSSLDGKDATGCVEPGRLSKEIAGRKDRDFPAYDLALGYSTTVKVHQLKNPACKRPKLDEELFSPE
jgi:hypothetical protein